MNVQLSPRLTFHQRCSGVRFRRCRAASAVSGGAGKVQTKTKAKKKANKQKDQKDQMLVALMDRLLLSPLVKQMNRKKADGSTDWCKRYIRTKDRARVTLSKELLLEWTSSLFIQQNLRLSKNKMWATVMGVISCDSIGFPMMTFFLPLIRQLLQFPWRLWSQTKRTETVRNCSLWEMCRCGTICKLEASLA